MKLIVRLLTQLNAHTHFNQLSLSVVTQLNKLALHVVTQLNAFALHLQGVSFRGIQDHFGWKSLSTAQNSVRRGEELARQLNLDGEKIRLKLAAYFDEILDITMQQLKEQVEAGRVTVDIDPEGKKSIRCTKGVDPRLLGEAGRGAIRFAQFVGLMDGDSNSGGTGDVSTNVVFISPTADGAAWDAAAPAVEVASKAVGQEFGQIEAANP